MVWIINFKADLADMRSLSQYNDNYNYILTVIDVLSKYAWAIPIKRKTGDFVVEAFKKVFKERKSKIAPNRSWIRMYR